MKFALFGIGFVLFVSTVIVKADESTNRQKAMQTLYQAYQRYITGDSAEGLKGVMATLTEDPEFAYAHIVRGEIAMRDGDWLVAQNHFESGLLLLKEPDQPLSPSPEIEIKPQEVEGDTRCFLGYVYIKLAQNASLFGDSETEQQYLELAYEHLNYGLKLSPGGEARELAEGLLKMFK